MATNIQTILRGQILDRRQKLEAAAQAIGENPEIARLLQEVDAALKRIDEGTYGLCIDFFSLSAFVPLKYF
jgi:RNA polymerase-binding transcription factor DksA